MDTEDPIQESNESILDSSPVQATIPSAKRAILIFVSFFLLQILAGASLGIVYVVIYAFGGGDLGDTEALNASIESSTMAIGLIASNIASLLLVFWLWRKARNPNDGITFQFLGIKKCSLASLRRPAAFGVGLVISYVLIASLLFPAADGAEFGPMTTMSQSSSWGLILWIVSVLLLAPVIEELLFRGLILKSFLQSWPSPPASYIAVSITVIGFTSLHYQEFVYYPFAGVGVLMMASMATYFRLKTDNLFAAGAVHLSYNFTLVLLVLFARLAS